MTIQNRDLQAELPKNVDLENNYTCIDCGEIVLGFFKFFILKFLILGSTLIQHLHEAHRLKCIPFACSECGFQK